MSDNVASRIRGIIVKLAQTGDREITGEDRLVEDLGLNSMALVELSVALETEFDLGVIDGDETPRLETVGDLEALVTTALSAGTQLSTGTQPA